jgi:hypothetical protein
MQTENVLDNACGGCCKTACCIATFVPCYAEYEIARIEKSRNPNTAGMCTSNPWLPGVCGAIGVLGDISGSIFAISNSLAISWIPCLSIVGPMTIFMQVRDLNLEGTADNCCCLCTQALCCYPCLVGKVWTKQMDKEKSTPVENEPLTQNTRFKSRAPVFVTNMQ